jgi:hypothetical protein
MQTEIGPRKGKADFRINDGIVEGDLSLLGQTRRCIGVINDSGVCTLSGKIRTLMQEINYTATGYLDEQKINLVLCGGKYVYHLAGSACATGERISI